MTSATVMSRVALCLCLSSLLVGAAFCQGGEEMMMAAAIMPSVEEEAGEEATAMPERPTAGGETNDTSGGVDLAPLEDLESAPEATMDEHVVEVGSSPPGQMIYNPESITIKSGDTVTWVNVDGIPHDVIFNEVPGGASNEDLSHPDLWSTIGQNVSSTFTVPGTYEYYCTPHRALGMLGSVVVEAA